MKKEKLNILKIFTWIGTRVLVLYLVLFLVSSLLADYRGLNDKAKIATLNRLRPTYDHLIQFMNGREKVDREKFEEYIYYYKKVVDYIPPVGEQPLHIADAYGVMGYCYHHLGQHRKAASVYQKAIDLKPEFFWFHYNLGVTYFNQGDYAKAEKSFTKAVSLNPDISLTMIFISKVYRAIIAKIDNTNKAINRQIPVRLKRGYENAAKLLILTYYNLEDYSTMLRLASGTMDAGVEDRNFFLYHAGLAAHKLNRHKTAVSFLQKYIKNNLRNPDAFHYLGLSLKALGVPTHRKAFEQEEVLREKSEIISIEEHEFAPAIF